MGFSVEAQLSCTTQRAPLMIETVRNNTLSSWAILDQMDPKDNFHDLRGV